MKHKLCISTQLDMLEVFAQVVGSSFEIQKKILVYRSSPPEAFFYRCSENM